MALVFKYVRNNRLERNHTLLFNSEIFINPLDSNRLTDHSCSTVDKKAADRISQIISEASTPDLACCDRFDCVAFVTTHLEGIIDASDP